VQARFGSFTFDTSTRRLARAGVPIHLTPKAFDLLALLIEAAPRVVPKAELHDRLWPRAFVSDATLVGLVKEVRRALGPDAVNLLRTAHRVGYAFSGTIDAARAPASGAPDSREASCCIIRGAERIPLAEGANMIGRDPSCAIWLDVAGVSRRHARIVVSGGSATLEDLGSKNGTLRGREAVTRPIELRDGDRFRIGGIDLLFRTVLASDDTKTEPRPAPAAPASA
jgi:DNA-binding winged helix-turn-helix (wHTH) protein